MKRHKQFYSEPTDNPDINRIIVIMRKPKKKSYFRRRMWLAWNYKMG